MMGAGTLGACRGGVSPDDADRSMKQYELAVGLRGEGNVPGAYKTLYKALEMDPGNAKAHLLLGHMFLLDRDDNPKEKDAKAEHHFREVLRIQTSDAKQGDHDLAPDAHNGLGVLYIHQGRHRAAIEVLQKAVDDLFNPEAYMAWGNIGWAQIELKDYPKAIEALQRAVKLAPQFCVGYFRLGQAYLATKEYAKAEESLTSALEADPRCKAFQEAWNLRGEARMGLGSREDARADFERCVEISPVSDAGKSCSRFLEATY